MKSFDENDNDGDSCGGDIVKFDDDDGDSFGGHICITGCSILSVVLPVLVVTQQQHISMMMYYIIDYDY